LNPTSDHNSSETERALFRRISEGDEDAFRDIFHSYRKILYPVILSLVKIEADAREILQETFLKLWLKRETLTAVESPGGWLYSVASTEALMHLRKEGRYLRRLQNAASTNATATAATNLNDIHTQFDTKEVKALIAEAVEKLPARRREVFRMSRLEGYSRKEIAETLGISENTVRNQLSDAVEFIRDYITKNKSLYLPVLLVWILIKK
jgi:RNA polymerase sigma-70 factor (family 1)